LTDEDPKVRRPRRSENAPVLVAVDFTADSKAALLWASDFASTFGAPLVVLHVVHDPADAPGYYRKGEADALRPMEDVAVEMMDEFLENVAKERPDLDILRGAEKALVKGIPATRILELAQTKNARLIVMGSRGRTGLPHLLLGSKAERVVQMSPIPVTIVKAEADDG
jgi:nucleotide-binding universal stress UspA family protein